MASCSNCSAALDPSWKFCIACGERVPAGAAAETRASRSKHADAAAAAPAALQGAAVPASDPAPAIPGAIRPDASPAAAPGPNPLVAVAVVALVVSLVAIGIVVLIQYANGL